MKDKGVPQSRAGTQAQAAGPDAQPPASWQPFTRLIFRFAFAYFGLYFLLSHILVYIFVLPNTLPGQGPGTLWPFLDVTSWVAVHILGITPPLVYTGNSRDTNF